MEKYKILQYPDLDALNAEINKLADKYAPVGNLIYAGDNFIQQVELTEEGEKLLEKQAKLNYVEVASSEEFVEALQGNKEIRLTSDLSLENFEVNKAVEIDLCGHSITLADNQYITVNDDFKLSNGTVVTSNSGTTNSYAIRAIKGNVELDRVTINASAAYGAFTTRPEKKKDVSVKISYCKFYAKSAGIVPVGGVYKVVSSEFYAIDEVKGWYAVSGNGLPENPPSDFVAENCIFSAAAPDGGAVYWPTDGKLQLKNCDLTGAVAAYIKCGDVRLAGGKYTASQPDKKPYVYSGNGFNPTGDVIVCDACNYPKKDAEVAILNIEFARACEDAYDVAEYEKEDHTSSQEVRLATNLKAKVLRLA